MNETEARKLLEERARALEDWLLDNGDSCRQEQRHLIDGTAERLYWHYGYLIAIRDLLRLISPTDEPKN